MERKNTNQCLGGLRMEGQDVRSPIKHLSGEEFFLPSTAA